VSRLTVNRERLFGRILRAGEIGREESSGVTAVAFSREDAAVVNLLASFMREAGLSVRLDSAGNLCGRREGRNPRAAVVMAGSHTDTVYGGGMFDGRLGIIGAIEAAQTMTENGIDTEHPIEVWGYRDEEGTRFARSYSGSRLLAGDFREGLLELTDRDGITIAQALRENGIDPDRVREAALPSGYARAHLELHIEQGRVLESRRLPVGIVTGLCCQVRGRFRIDGEAGHAGTPMNLRRDPLAAAGEMIVGVEQAAQAAENVSATVGRIEAFPGGVNIIPGAVEFSLDIRGQSLESRDAVLERVLSYAKEICARRKVEMAFRVLNRGASPALCAPEVQDVIGRACAKAGVPVFKLASPAGHDSGSMSRICPMGMIFVRSKGGASHSAAEWSSQEDCALGTEVLYHALLELAVPYAN
jgi:allantoate deiminase